MDSFLAGNDISASPNWNAIVQDPAFKLPRQPPDQPGAIAVKAERLWGLAFSSSQNALKFGAISPSGSEASTPDVPPDAVLSLVITNEATTSRTLETIVTAFGLRPTNSSPKVAALFGQIDPGRSLQLSLDTSIEARNALWFLSGPVYRTAVSLVYVISDAILPKLEAFVNSERGLRLLLVNRRPRMTIKMLRSYSVLSPDPNTIHSDSSFEILLSLQTDSFDVLIRLDASGMELRLSDPPNTLLPPGPILSRLNTTINGSTTAGPTMGSLPDTNSFFKDIALWYVIQAVSEEQPQTDDNGNDVSIPGISHWQIVLLASWQSEAGVVLALQYDSRTPSLFGRLLFKSDESGESDNRHFDYDAVLDIKEISSKILPAPVDLWKLFDQAATAPPQIPHLLSNASVQFQKLTGDELSIAIAGVVASDSTIVTPRKSAQSAPDGFLWNRASFHGLLQTSGSNLSTKISVSTEMTLRLSATSPATKFYLDIAYASGGSWLLHAQVDEVPLALLSNFFAPSVQAAAAKIFGGVILRTLQMIYTYDSSGEATSFFVSAILVLGELELDLRYEYASVLLQTADIPASRVAKTEGLNSPDSTELRPQENVASWTFEASLGAASPQTNVEKVVASLGLDAKVLPSFIGKIPVGDNASGKAAVKLTLREASGSTILAIAVTIDVLSMTIISVASPNDGPRKTVLRVSVDEFALAKKVPLIKELPQPFDTLLYLWLQDDTTDAERKGIFGPDLLAINAQLTSANISVIAVKDTNKQNDALPVLRAGHHFMVTNKDTVVLDHNFSDADARSTTEGTTDPAPPVGAVEPAPTKGAIDKKLPFLSITALGLLYKRGVLGISIDATVQLGPITFSMIGFSLGVVLSTISLNKLKGAELDVNLNGLEVLLDSPPISLAGVFTHAETASQDSFRGGVSLSFSKWKFLAVGEYAVIAPTTGRGEFKSVFVYAKLNGPLFTLAFATVSGVRVGLGYNSVVRSPKLTELANFPFLNGSVDGDSGQDPRKIIDSMTQEVNGSPAWVNPKDESYWVAAGLTMTAFGMLAITAVLIFGVRDTGFVISVFANGVAQIPSEVKPEQTLFYVELNMLAELNTVEGYFTVQAALAPTSHVLVPACRLTGGFALMNWFAPNVNAGDFVFTVGGYHRAFTPPPWYPLVPRLGVSFTLGKMINVTGVVYFAITPKCVMGGGALHLGLDVGPVSAWLDAAIDVFIQFKPFHYTADLSVSVGCAITIKVWFVRVRIAASVGATVHIEGPDPFGGSAHVDFYLFGFTIDFGPQPKPPPAVVLSVFYEMVHTPGPAPAVGSVADELTDPMMARLNFTLTGGIVPKELVSSETAPAGGPFPDTGASKPWNVKPGTFSFSIECDFALSAAEIQEGKDDSLTTRVILLPDGSETLPKVFSKPMHLGLSDPLGQNQAINSRLQITIWRILSDEEKERISGFRGSLEFKRVPTAIWGPYSGGEDPALTKNPEALKSGTQPTVELCMGVSLLPPEPQIVESNIIAFDTSIAFKEEIKPPLPLETYSLDPSTAQQDTLLAGPTLFPDDSPVDRWQHFADDWKAANERSRALIGRIGADGTQDDGLLKLTSSWLGWDAPSPGISETSETRAAWILNGSLPGNLVDILGEEYSALPRMSTMLI